MPKTPWILTLALLVPTGIFAGAPVDADEDARTVEEKLIELGEQENQVMDVLHHLVNVIGPRLTASHQDIQACEWAKKRFEEMGLQNVVMEEAGEFPVAFRRGPWFGKMIAPKEMVLEFGTPAWSAGTRGAVTGTAMVPPESIEGADQAAYAGAWILTPSAPRRMDREQRQQQRAVRDWLGEAGVAGFVNSTRNEYITTGGRPVQWEDIPTIPRINLRKDHFDAVMAELEGGQVVQLQFDIRNHFDPGPVKFYNVYGDIVGTEFPDEYVVVGGHIDSWDGASGTTDNGMGAATTIEAARLLTAAGAKPRRTIRFMLWSGEEQGLLGSKAYVEKYPDLLPKTSAVLVYDGGPNAIASLPTSKAMHAQMEEAFESVIGLHPELPFELKEQENGLPRGIGSDHESFLPRGVPGFFWDQEGRADWRHGIHTQFDTYDLAIPEYLEHSTLVIALGSLGIADLDGLLDRTEMTTQRSGGGGRRMGVFLDDLLVQGVVPDSPAEKAGIQEGDVLYKIDGTVLEDRRSLGSAIRGGEPKKSIVVKRDGKEVTLTIEWPEEKKEEEKKERVVL